jgi:hypothetical protein
MSTIATQIAAAGLLAVFMLGAAEPVPAGEPGASAGSSYDLVIGGMT